MENNRLHKIWNTPSDCCGVMGAFCSSDSQCCSGVPCDNPVENAGNKCGCPTDYTWVLGECVYGPDTCEDGPPATIECDVPSYQNAFCLFQLPLPYTQSCCKASSYGGIDYYEKEYVQVITV